MSLIGAGQHSNALVLLAEAEVESGWALVIGVLEGCDGETERGGEGLPQVGDAVEEGVEREELGPSRPRDDPLRKCHLDGAESIRSEDLFDGCSSSNGGVVEERAGYHTDGDDERAERFGFAGVGVG